jgi:hypothetical protein
VASAVGWPKDWGELRNSIAKRKSRPAPRGLIRRLSLASKNRVPEPCHQERAEATPVLYAKHTTWDTTSDCHYSVNFQLGFGYG